MSCRSAARLARSTLAPTSAAIMPAMRAPERADCLRAHRVDSHLEEDAFPLLVDGLGDLLGDLLDDLLYARRMYPPVRYQAAERRFGNLPPYGVKTGDHHRLRSVVDDDVHARQ